MNLLRNLVFKLVASYILSDRSFHPVWNLNYELNLSNYQCTALGLTSHGMMKMGKVELELLSDTEQALVDDQGYPREFTESQIEVGNLIINRYMGESFY